MFVRPAYSAASNHKQAPRRIRCHLGPGFAILLAASLCALLGACGDDTQVATSTSTQNVQNGAAAQAFSPPALTIKTPAAAPSEVGAAASDSLATPVIHTVD